MTKDEIIEMVSKLSAVDKKETEEVLNTFAELLNGLGSRIDLTFRHWGIQIKLNNKNL